MALWCLVILAFGEELGFVRCCFEVLFEHFGCFCYFFVNKGILEQIFVAAWLGFKIFCIKIVTIMFIIFQNIAIIYRSHAGGHSAVGWGGVSDFWYFIIN